ncbi:MAG TPA: sulfate transporter [Planctomycetes bacterium]|nr:sulfate transporter [Planctomycetota bacterium]
MTSAAPPPQGNLEGLRRHYKADLTSGFLVFLIALPLCLGISLACGYPAIAGVFTAIVGALVSTFLSNSELTIKGPAAGLIVIALGAITEFTQVYGAERAYQLALGVGVAAGVLQILFGLFRTGVLGEFFPTSAVHGMLAAIGVIIMAKQIHITLGVEAKGGPLELIREIPHSIAHANPEIAFIGVVSLLILFGMPLLKSERLRKIPAPLVVVLVSIPLGVLFDLSHEHTYTLFDHRYKVGEEFLVAVPKSLFSAITGPDFEALKTFVGWKWVLMFALIGSLESLLSAKAVDMLDPHQRKTNLDRDMVAVGVGNTIASCIGGLPMISEIVRSKANIDNGAQTRFANFFHGLFLLVFVALLPALIHRIPLAALSAMLVYTGFRLASPSEFRHAFEIGKEQLAIFVATLIAVLATDLLIGIGIGIAVKFLIHMSNGVPLRSLFRPTVEVEQEEGGRCRLLATDALVFSNWIPFKRRIEQAGVSEGKHVIVDLARTRLVDHTVMEKLHALRREFEQAGRTLEIDGLDMHHGLSEHDLAARRRGLAPIRRLTVVCERTLEEQLEGEFLRLGVSGYTSIPCRGASRTTVAGEGADQVECARIEFVVQPGLLEALLEYLRQEVMPKHSVMVCVETVEVTRVGHF